MRRVWCAVCGMCGVQCAVCDVHGCAVSECAVGGCAVHGWAPACRHDVWMWQAQDSAEVCVACACADAAVERKAGVCVERESLLW